MPGGIGIDVVGGGFGTVGGTPVGGGFTPVVGPPPIGGTLPHGPLTVPLSSRDRGKMKATQEQPYNRIAGERAFQHKLNILQIPNVGVGVTAAAQAALLDYEYPVILEGLADAAGVPTVRDFLYAMPFSRENLRTPTAGIGPNGEDISAVRSVGGKLFLPFGGRWYVWYGGGNICHVQVHDARDPIFAIGLMQQGGAHRLLSGGADIVLAAAAASVQILASNRWRSRAIICNTGVNPLRLATGENATNTNGLLVAANGGSYTIAGPTLDFGAWNAFSQLGTSVAVKDWI